MFNFLSIKDAKSRNITLLQYNIFSKGNNNTVVIFCCIQKKLTKVLHNNLRNLVLPTLMANIGPINRLDNVLYYE